jgi:hypothetical protein
MNDTAGHAETARGEALLDRRIVVGADGFEKMVDRVAGIEKSLGIYDLAQFTPRA